MSGKLHVFIETLFQDGHVGGVAVSVQEWSGHRRHDHPGPDNGVKLVDPAVPGKLERVVTKFGIDRGKEN